MEFGAVRDCLVNCKVLANLGEADLGLMLLKGTVRRVIKGQVLMRQGEQAGGVIYLILQGEVQVLDDEGRERSRRGPSEIIGEIGAIRPEHTRSRSVVATQEIELMEFSLDELDRCSPGMAASLVKCLEGIAWIRERN